jgi:hypothetical protein
MIIHPTEQSLPAATAAINLSAFNPVSNIRNQLTDKGGWPF